MILTISPSSFGSLQECPTKYNYGSLKRLRPLEEKRDKMDRGSLFHEMLEFHYTMQKNKIPYNEIVLGATELAREKYRNDEYEYDITEECVKNYQEYAIYYASDGWEPLEIEVPFSKVLYEGENHKIVSEGIIDLIAKNLTESVFPIDHKTTDQQKGVTILNNQFMNYCWATDTNVMVKNEIGFQKTYGPGQRFKRHVLTYDKTHLEEWRENVILYCMNLIGYIEKDYFPKNFSSCQYCRYKRICESTPDSRDYKISSMYKVGEAFDIFAKHS